MSETPAIPSRRARFRELVARLDGSADPMVAFDSGLCVVRPDNVAERLAASLEIRPKGTHLVVGSIGSGKTTELLRLKRLVEERTDDSVCAYVDAGEFTEKPCPGALVAAAREARRRVHLEREFHEGDFLAAASWIYLLDGFDRTLDLAAFRGMVATDIPWFTSGSFGLVCVGPPQLQAELPSVEADWFERTEICGALDIKDEQSFRFLAQVLKTRTTGLVAEDVAEDLVIWSGGILRDLLLIARLAVEEAYVDGADEVGEDHATAAARRMGLSLLRAIDAELWEKLKDLLRRVDGEKGLLEVTNVSEDPLTRRLVLHRLLIPLPGIPARYLVHPCVVPAVTRPGP